MTSLLLQLFILLNVFLIGVAVTIAIQHALAHFKAPQVEKTHQVAQSTRLPMAIRDHLLKTSKEHYQKILDQSAVELQHNLKMTTIRLNQQVDKLGSEIIKNEINRYHADLDKLRAQAEATINNAQSEIDNHQIEIKAKLADYQTQMEAKLEKQQSELEAKMSDDIIIKKAKIVSQIDTKLADAVTSFLTETLQHNVDLGSQSNYLISMLDEHKNEIIKGINDEA